LSRFSIIDIFKHEGFTEFEIPHTLYKHGLSMPEEYLAERLRTLFPNDSKNMRILIVLIIESNFGEI
jgi:hypothetical protein